MKILSSNSLEELRNIVRADEKFVLEPLDELISRYSLALVEVEIEVPKNFSLLNPINDSWSGNMDKQNAELMHNFFPNLSRASATDERLWVTLAFREAFDYSINRWGDDEIDNRTIINHWFAPSSRAKWRDHSVSRLWFISSFASSLEGIDLHDALSVLFSNSDLLGSLLGRPRTSSSTRISSKIVATLFKDGQTSIRSNFEREKFRAFMKELDLRSGAIQIDALNDVEFDIFFNDLFSTIYLSKSRT